MNINVNIIMKNVEIRKTVSRSSISASILESKIKIPVHLGAW